MQIETQEQLMKNFQIIRVMGQGSFGKVFLIRNIHTFEQYAMKKYSSYHLKKTGKDESLQRSVIILRSLNHKGILKIIKYIITKEDSIYLFFEACKKGSLEYIILLLQNSNEQNLIDFVLFQLIEGLHYLKSVSVAHRDLKPSNIAFTNEAQLKIIDFDEATCFKKQSLILVKNSNQDKFPQISDNPIYVSRRSRAMSFVGTYSYMSPQMKSKTQSDQSGDVWALGCIIYEMFMNKTITLDSQEQKDFINQIKIKLSLMKNQNIPQNYMNLLQKIFTIDPKERISIVNIYNDTTFDKFRLNKQFYQNTQNRLRKLLRGNYSVPNRQTLYDALRVDLIGMKAGKEAFQKLKTVVFINKNFHYDVMHLIGGPKYFKLRDIKDQYVKRYIFYDEIESIKIENDYIVIKIVPQKWTNNHQQKMQLIQIKHLYQNQKILGKLFELMLNIYND